MSTYTVAFRYFSWAFLFQRDKEPQDVRGFTLNACDVKLSSVCGWRSHFFFCKDCQSVSEATQVTKRYCGQTACAVNWAKWLGIWHGHWDVTQGVFRNVAWSNKSAVNFGVSLNNYRESNELWRGGTERLTVKATRWGGHDLSCFVCAIVCNISLWLNFLYLSQVLHCSRVHLQRMQRMFSKFIWNSKCEKRSVIIYFARYGQVDLVFLICLCGS